MHNSIKGAIAGSAGAVFVSIIGAAVYDFIKGNDLFATLVQFLASFVKLMVRKIYGINVPVWLLLLILLTIIVTGITVIQRRSEQKQMRKKPAKNRGRH
jgi:hypothetical protein